MLKNIIFAIFCVFLVGCAKDTTTYQNNQTINHPTMPKPIQERSFKNKVIVQGNNEVFVAKTYEDDIEFNIWLEDILRYMTDLKSTLCFYRKELNEVECSVKKD